MRRAVAPAQARVRRIGAGRAEEREQHFVVEAQAVALRTFLSKQRRALEEKNAKLKKLLAERMLVAAALRALLSRKS